MTGLQPGDQFVHEDRSDRDYPVIEWFEVIDPDCSVGRDRALTDEQAARYGLRSGLGNRQLSVRLRGRGGYYAPHGVLARTIGLDRTVRSGDGLLSLFTSGHDCHPLGDWITDWHDHCPDPTVATRRIAATAAVAELYLAVANPRPSKRYLRSRVESTVGLIDDPTLLHPTHLTRPDHVDAVPDEWIGEPHHRFVTLATADGNLVNVATWHVVPDLGGSILDRVHANAERDATSQVRSRMRDALKAVARSLDINEGRVNVGLDTVTIPHRVLEALVLGDELGVAAVLDGIAELVDTLTDTRNNRVDVAATGG